MTLLPTHKCFDDALEFIEELVKAHLDKSADIIENIQLVHAICLMPDGRPYSHAWVEDKETDSVYFRGIIEGKTKQFIADRKEYYDRFKVQETTKYTLLQVHKENRRTGTYGPWEQKYISLVKK